MGIITLDVSAKVNQPPNSSGWLKLDISFNELYVFTLANFTTETSPPYGDPENDDFASIKITSLPAQGVLSLNNVACLVGDEITSTDLNSGLFKYQADGTDINGYTSGEMEFTVADIGSNSFTTSPSNVTFEVDSNINEAPSSIGDGEADVVVGQSILMTTAMLTSDLNPPYSDPEGDNPSMLLVITVPEYGNLELDGVIVIDDQEISFDDIDSGKLFYVNREFPSGNVEGFDFKISDEGSGEYRG